MILRKSIIVFLMLVIFYSIAHAKLYIWVDKAGVKHMSNIAPKDEVVLKEEKLDESPKSLESKEDLVIIDWFPTETKTGFTISGEVKNNSSFLFYKNVMIRATIKDEKGENLFKEEVKTDPYDIPPEKTASFKFENVNTKLTYLSKKNLRFDILNSSKDKVEEKKAEPEKEKDEKAVIE
jgi:hypothetical protein